MRTLAVVHQDDAGPGVFAPELRAVGSLEIWRPAEAPAPDATAFDAVLVLGGGMHPDQEERHPWLEAERATLAAVHGGGVPMLGVCLGAELIAQALGGSARRAAAPQIGWHEVRLTPEGAGDRMIGSLPPSFRAFSWHSYELVPPPGSVVLAADEHHVQAFRTGASTWAVQFHAEASREIAEGWIQDYHHDPDALAAGVEPDALRTQTRREIATWNALGVELCRAFMRAAAARRAGRAR